MKKESQEQIGKIIKVQGTKKIKVKEGRARYHCRKCFFGCIYRIDRIDVNEFEEKEKLNCLDGYYYEEVRK